MNMLGQRQTLQWKVKAIRRKILWIPRFCCWMIIFISMLILANASVDMPGYVYMYTLYIVMSPPYICTMPMFVSLRFYGQYFQRRWPPPYGTRWAKLFLIDVPSKILFFTMVCLTECGTYPKFCYGNLLSCLIFSCISSSITLNFINLQTYRQTLSSV